MTTAKGFRFTPDADGIFRATSGPEVAKFLDQRATDAAKEIRKRAPSKRGFMDYRKNVKTTKARRVGTTIQAEVYVDSPTWHLPEYGTSRISPSAPIRNGVRAAGIDFKE